MVRLIHSWFQMRDCLQGMQGRQQGPVFLVKCRTPVVTRFFPVVTVRLQIHASLYLWPQRQLFPEVPPDERVHQWQMPLYFPGMPVILQGSPELQSFPFAPERYQRAAHLCRYFQWRDW
ncbi:Uncharacterised protein [Shigella sonnei]|nr:Uncharacterised protein [Shigella sonnei]